ncbi:MAG: response regulator, partial [Phaeodactylibacter sp.]|nr:response regulator [Phaeodactylibacter sp.]
MLSVSIIDDEPHAQEALRAMLTELCPDVRILGEANGVASGIQLIEEMRPDAIFLDIKMNDGTGFDLLKHFPNPAFNII